MRLALQCRLFGENRRWHHAVPFDAMDVEKIGLAVEILAKVCKTEWRVVVDDDRQQVIAEWRDGKWFNKGNA